MKADHSNTRALPDDRGATLIEVLISIVLLGIAVVPMLTLLAVTVTASATERDHANAHAWLQIAADKLYGHARHDCGSVSASDVTNVIADYQGVVGSTSSPEGWDSSLIDVTSVMFWDGDVYQTTCYDDTPNLALQLIELQVRNPSGEIVETVEVVKG